MYFRDQIFRLHAIFNFSFWCLRVHACNVFSISFKINVVFQFYNEGPNTQIRNCIPQKNYKKSDLVLAIWKTRRITQFDYGKIKINRRKSFGKTNLIDKRNVKNIRYGERYRIQIGLFNTNLNNTINLKKNNTTQIQIHTFTIQIKNYTALMKIIQ